MKANRRILHIIEMVIGIVWLALVLLLGTELYFGRNYWLGFGFGLMSFLVVLGAQFLYSAATNPSTTEIAGIPIYYSVGYLLISIVRNTFAMFASISELVSPLVIFNLIALVAYIILMVLSAHYFNRVNAQLAYEQQSKISVQNISAQLGAMLAKAPDDEKLSIKKLKEAVDYSNNLTQTFTKVQEEEFLRLLLELQGLIECNGEKSLIEKKITQLNQLWQARNSIIAIKQ